MATLTLRGVPILKSKLSTADLQNIKDELTVSPVLGVVAMGKPPKYNIYLESKSKLYLPKNYALKRFGGPLDIRFQGEDINVGFTGDLRPEQQEPVKCILEACKDPMKMGGVLNVFCGGGKTTMALYCVAELAKRTLIVVHKDFLSEQWRERISQFVPTARIGYIRGKTLDIEGKDIVIASLQSLSMKDYEPEIFKSFGTLIIDEVHHTSAEVFNKALFKTCFRYTIGLSATVDRKDGLSKVFIWHLGDVVYKSTAREDFVHVDAIMLKDNNDPEYSGEEYIGMSSKINFSKMINNVCAYGPRILKVVDILVNIPPGRKVLVLSDRVQHLKEIMVHIKASDKTCGLYIGGMKAKALKECEGKDIIFATFAIASEGYDQKDLDTLVLASPKSDIVQSVGRILRDKECDRKHIPRIIDIVDKFSVFEMQWYKRRAYYKKCNYTIKATHDDL